MRGRWSNIIFLNVHETSEEKNYDSKDSFYEELEEDLIVFLSTIWKFCWEILMQKWRERIFSNRQLSMRVYNMIAMVMLLEQ